MKVFKYNRTKALIIVQIIIALVITMFNGYTLARYITEEKKLKISATYSIIVPMYFCGEIVTEVTVPITVTSKFNPKFN